MQRTNRKKTIQKQQITNACQGIYRLLGASSQSAWMCAVGEHEIHGIRSNHAIFVPTWTEWYSAIFGSLRNVWACSLPAVYRWVVDASPKIIKQKKLQSNSRICDFEATTHSTQHTRVFINEMFFMQNKNICTEYRHIFANKHIFCNLKMFCFMLCLVLN